MRRELKIIHEKVEERKMEGIRVKRGELENLFLLLNEVLLSTVWLLFCIEGYWRWGEVKKVGQDEEQKARIASRVVRESGVQSENQCTLKGISDRRSCLAAFSPFQKSWVLHCGAWGAREPNQPQWCWGVWEMFVWHCWHAVRSLLESRFVGSLVFHILRRKQAVFNTCSYFSMLLKSQICPCN